MALDLQVPRKLAAFTFPFSFGLCCAIILKFYATCCRLPEIWLRLCFASASEYAPCLCGASFCDCLTHLQNFCSSLLALFAIGTQLRVSQTPFASCRTAPPPVPPLCYALLPVGVAQILVLALSAHRH